MAVMAADTAFTRADRDALPEDGRRQELLEGALLVPPSPGFAHQRVLMALIDTTTERHLYERPGVPSYWLVAPIVPSITVLELLDGGYSERAHLTGDATVALSTPFPVELSAPALRPT